MKRILIITPFFRPNMGGVETHLNDLCNYLSRSGYYVNVVTYQPLTTKERGLYSERKENLEIHRTWWFGFNLFHRLEKYPLFEFLYITPILLCAAFLFMVFNGKRIDVIHAHGFNSAFIAWALKVTFDKPVVVSTHAIYGLKGKGLFCKVLSFILNGTDKVLCISQPSMNELIKIGVQRKKLGIYIYWVDQEVFKPLDKILLRKKIGWEGKFIVLFVGRFIVIKGIRLLLEVAEKVDKNIHFAFIGDGPLAKEIITASKTKNNVIFLGKIINTKLVDYYNAANMLCVPSLYEEAFGRVVAEALSCSLPVVVSNRGGMADIVDKSIGVKIESMTIDELSGVLNHLYNNRAQLESLMTDARTYALSRFNKRNINFILKAYEDVGIKQYIR